MPGINRRNIQVTPLTLAVIKADNPANGDSRELYMQVIQTLLQNGADLYYREQNGRTPLMFVKENGKLCEMLLKQVKDEDSEDGKENNTTTKIEDSQEISEHMNGTGDHSGEFESSKVQKEYVNKFDDFGFTALHLSSSKEVCETLLNYGADITAMDKYGCTPLIAAVIGTCCKSAQRHTYGSLIKLLNATESTKDRCNAYELLAANVLVFQAYVMYVNRNEDFDEEVATPSIDLEHTKARYYLSKADTILPENSSLQNDRRELYGDHANEMSLRNRFLKEENLDLEKGLILGILIQERILGETHPRALFSLFLLFVMNTVLFQSDNIVCSLTNLQHFQLYKRVYHHCLHQNLHFQLSLEDAVSYDAIYDFHIKKWIESLNIEEEILEIVDDILYFFKRYFSSDVQHGIPASRYSCTYLRFLVLWLFGFCHLTKLRENTSSTRQLCQKLKTLKRILANQNLEYTFLELALEQSLFHGRNKDHGVKESPGLKLMKMLYENGFSPNARSSQGETQLTFYSRLKFHHTGGKGQSHSFCVQLLESMLQNGLHADLVDEKGRTVIKVLENKVHIDEVGECSLKCLASRVIVKSGIPFQGHIPYDLYEFVEYHRNLSL